ncbi:unnamed protein product [Diamesa serratosioi]
MVSLPTVSYLVKAKEVIREDETRKAQSLEQFREWINKHPAFKNYRTDDAFFLAFLRARKFNNSKAYELFENYFCMLKKNPKWHLDCKTRTDNIMKTIDRGVFYPLLERDAEGRNIILLQLGKLDISIDTSESVQSTSFEICTQLLEDEVTQICGCIYVIDCTGFTMKLMSLFSISDIQTLADNVKNSTTIGLKGIYYINMPSFGNVLFEIFKMAMSDKLKSRLFLLKDLDELKSKIDGKILPKELGGVIPEAEMIKGFKEMMKQNQKKRQQTHDTLFDPTMIERNKTVESDTGSFRKLEVD